MAVTGTTITSPSVTGLGLSGLSSGLDTSSIITKLMAIEKAPQTLLSNRLGTLQAHTKALQSLNTAIAGISTTAKGAATGSLASFTTSSSSSDVSAVASSSATTGSVSFTVDRLAAAQTTLSGAMTTWDPSTTLTLTTGSGAAAKTTAISTPSTNLDDIVAEINSKGVGVTATKVAAGTDASGATQFRLQLRSGTGASNAFSITATKSGATAAWGTTTQSAADAQITVRSGTGSTATADVVTAPTNTFDDVLTGLDVTVSAAGPALVTVGVVADSTAASTSAQALTAGLIQLFGAITSATATTTTAATSGTSSGSATTGSVLTGDPGVRALKDALLTAATGPVAAAGYPAGRSAASIGIVLTKDGTITFDQAAFETAMKNDPAGTTTMFQTIAGRVGEAAAAAADPLTGTLTQRITSETGQQSSLSAQVTDWDTRLAAIQTQYTQQFNAMETALNALSAQSSYLTSQIAGLTTNYQSTS